MRENFRTLMPLCLIALMIGLAGLIFFFVNQEVGDAELDDGEAVVDEESLPRARIPERVASSPQSEIPAEVPESHVVDGQLQPAHKVEDRAGSKLRRILVQVIDQASGDPIPEASIFASVARGRDGKLLFPRLIGKTNTDGLLRVLTDLQTKLLAATAKGYVASTELPLDGQSGLTISLRPSQSLTIRLVDRNRNPVSSVFVRVSRFGRKLDPFHMLSSEADKSGFDDYDYRVRGAWSDANGQVQFDGLGAGDTRFYIDNDELVTTSGHHYVDVVLPSPLIEVVVVSPMIVGFEFEDGMKVPFQFERPGLENPRGAPSQFESAIWRKLTALWPQSTFVVMPLDEPQDAALSIRYKDGESWKVANIPFVKATLFQEPYRIKLNSKKFRMIRIGFRLPSGKWLSDFDQFRIKEKDTGAIVANGKSVDIQLIDGLYYAELTTVLAPSYRSRFDFEISENTTSVDFELKHELWRVPVKIQCDDGPRMRLRIEAQSEANPQSGIAYVFGEKFDVWLSTKGNYKITATSAGYHSSPVDVSYDDGTWKNEAVELVLKRNGTD